MSEAEMLEIIMSLGWPSLEQKEAQINAAVEEQNG